MSWEVIARQDARQTLDAKSVRYLLGLLVFGILLSAYIYPVAGEEPITTARFTGYLTGWLTTLVPLVGILVGYNAVVSERESGSLRLSLALPHSRRDVLLGKLAGRAGVVAGVVLATFVAAGALVVYPYGDLELPRSLAFVALTAGFTALWVGLGVAISLFVATKRQALVLAFGLFFLFVFAWGTVESVLEVGLDAAGIVDGELPDALQFVFGLSPNRAYTTVTDGFLNPAASVSGPWYLGEWVALVVFLAWLVGPLGVAYLRFTGRDIA
jgi:ABC-2 type transport system permease protein